MSLLTPDSELGLHLATRKLLAVVVIDDADLAVPMARALLHGGVDTLELTLRTDAALESVKRIATEVPQVRIGAGTVLTEKQVDEVLSAGAHFAVAPSTNRQVLRHAKQSGLPFSPGVMTPSDIDTALQEECHIMKYFPATSAGGLPHLKNIAAPFSHLGAGFIPLGGISSENLGTWLGDPMIVAVGGSWLAPAAEIRESRWDLIATKARHAMEIIHSQGMTK